MPIPDATIDTSKLNVTAPAIEPEEKPPVQEARVEKQTIAQPRQSVEPSTKSATSPGAVDDKTDTENRLPALEQNMKDWRDEKTIVDFYRNMHTMTPEERMTGQDAIWRENPDKIPHNSEAEHQAYEESMKLVKRNPDLQKAVDAVWSRDIPHSMKVRESDRIVKELAAGRKFEQGGTSIMDPMVQPTRTLYFDRTGKVVFKGDVKPTPAELTLAEKANPLRWAGGFLHGTKSAVTNIPLIVHGNYILLNGLKDLANKIPGAKYHPYALASQLGKKISPFDKNSLNIEDKLEGWARASRNSVMDNEAIRNIMVTGWDDPMQYFSYQFGDMVGLMVNTMMARKIGAIAGSPLGPKGAMIGAHTAGYAAMAGLETSSFYLRAIDQGMPKEAAVKVAQMYGALSGGVEYGSQALQFGNMTFKGVQGALKGGSLKAGKAAIARFQSVVSKELAETLLKRAGISAIEEATEEMVQSMLDQAFMIMGFTMSEGSVEKAMEKMFAGAGVEGHKELWTDWVKDTLEQGASAAPSAFLLTMIRGTGSRINQNRKFNQMQTRRFNQMKERYQKLMTQGEYASFTAGLDAGAPEQAMQALNRASGRLLTEEKYFHRGVAGTLDNLYRRNKKAGTYVELSSLFSDLASELQNDPTFDDLFKGEEVQKLLSKQVVVRQRRYDSETGREIVDEQVKTQWDVLLDMVGGMAGIDQWKGTPEEMMMRHEQKIQSLASFLMRAKRDDVYGDIQSYAQQLGQSVEDQSGDDDMPVSIDDVQDSFVRSVYHESRKAGQDANSPVRGISMTPEIRARMSRWLAGTGMLDIYRSRIYRKESSQDDDGRLAMGESSGAYPFDSEWVVSSNTWKNPKQFPRLDTEDAAFLAGQQAYASILDVGGEALPENLSPFETVKWIFGDQAPVVLEQIARMSLAGAHFEHLQKENEPLPLAELFSRNTPEQLAAALSKYMGVGNDADALKQLREMFASPFMINETDTDATKPDLNALKLDRLRARQYELESLVSQKTASYHEAEDADELSELKDDLSEVSEEVEAMEAQMEADAGDAEEKEVDEPWFVQERMDVREVFGSFSPSKALNLFLEEFATNELYPSLDPNARVDQLTDDEIRLYIKRNLNQDAKGLNRDQMRQLMQSTIRDADGKIDQKKVANLKSSMQAYADQVHWFKIHKERLEAMSEVESTLASALEPRAVSVPLSIVVEGHETTRQATLDELETMAKAMPKQFKLIDGDEGAEKLQKIRNIQALKAARKQKVEQDVDRLTLMLWSSIPRDLETYLNNLRLSSRIMQVPRGFDIEGRRTASRLSVLEIAQDNGMQITDPFFQTSALNEKAYKQFGKIVTQVETAMKKNGLTAAKNAKVVNMLDKLRGMSVPGNAPEVSVLEHTFEKWASAMTANFGTADTLAMIRQIRQLRGTSSFTVDPNDESIMLEQRTELGSRQVVQQQFFNQIYQNIEGLIGLVVSGSPLVSKTARETATVEHWEAKEKDPVADMTKAVRYLAVDIGGRKSWYRVTGERVQRGDQWISGGEKSLLEGDVASYVWVPEMTQTGTFGEAEQFDSVKAADVLKGVEPPQKTKVVKEKVTSTQELRLIPVEFDNIEEGLRKVATVPVDKKVLYKGMSAHILDRVTQLGTVARAALEFADMNDGVKFEATRLATMLEPVVNELVSLLANDTSTMSHRAVADAVTLMESLARMSGSPDVRNSLDALNGVLGKMEVQRQVKNRLPGDILNAVRFLDDLVAIPDSAEFSKLLSTGVLEAFRQSDPNWNTFNEMFIRKHIQRVSEVFDKNENVISVEQLSLLAEDMYGDLRAIVYDKIENKIQTLKETEAIPDFIREASERLTDWVSILASLNLSPEERLMFYEMATYYIIDNPKQNLFVPEVSRTAIEKVRLQIRNSKDNSLNIRKLYNKAMLERTEHVTTIDDPMDGGTWYKVDSKDSNGQRDLQDLAASSWCIKDAKAHAVSYQARYDSAYILKDKSNETRVIVWVKDGYNDFETTDERNDHSLDSKYKPHLAALAARTGLSLTNTRWRGDPVRLGTDFITIEEARALGDFEEDRGDVDLGPVEREEWLADRARERARNQVDDPNAPMERQPTREEVEAENERVRRWEQHQAERQAERDMERRVALRELELQQQQNRIALYDDISGINDTRWRDYQGSAERIITDSLIQLWNDINEVDRPQNEMIFIERSHDMISEFLSDHRINLNVYDLGSWYHVIDRYAPIVFHQLEYAMFSKTETGDIQGYYDPRTDEAFVIRKNLSEAETPQVVLHEVAHRGMYRVARALGGVAELHNILEAARPVLEANAASLLERTGHDSIESLAGDYGFDTATVDGQTRLLMELTARYAERFSERNQETWWKELTYKLVQWFKQFANVILNESQVDDLVRNFLYYGSERVNRDGSPLQSTGDMVQNREQPGLPFEPDLDAEALEALELADNQILTQAVNAMAMVRVQADSFFHSSDAVIIDQLADYTGDLELEGLTDVLRDTHISRNADVQPGGEFLTIEQRDEQMREKTRDLSKRYWSQFLKSMKGGKAAKESVALIGSLIQRRVADRMGMSYHDFMRTQFDAQGNVFVVEDEAGWREAMMNNNSFYRDNPGLLDNLFERVRGSIATTFTQAANAHRVVYGFWNGQADIATVMHEMTHFAMNSLGYAVRNKVATAQELEAWTALAESVGMNPDTLYSNWSSDAVENLAEAVENLFNGNWKFQTVQDGRVHRALVNVRKAVRSLFRMVMKHLGMDYETTKVTFPRELGIAMERMLGLDAKADYDAIVEGAKGIKPYKAINGLPVPMNQVAPFVVLTPDRFAGTTPNMPVNDLYEYYQYMQGDAEPFNPETGMFATVHDPDFQPVYDALEFHFNNEMPANIFQELQSEDEADELAYIERFAEMMLPEGEKLEDIPRDLGTTDEVNADIINKRHLAVKLFNWLEGEAQKAPGLLRRAYRRLGRIISVVGLVAHDNPAFLPLKLLWHHNASASKTASIFSRKWINDVTTIKDASGKTVLKANSWDELVVMRYLQAIQWLGFISSNGEKIGETIPNVLGEIKYNPNTMEKEMDMDLQLIHELEKKNGGAALGFRHDKSKGLILTPEVINDYINALRQYMTDSSKSALYKKMNTQAFAFMSMARGLLVGKGQLDNHASRLVYMHMFHADQLDEATNEDNIRGVIGTAMHDAKESVTDLLTGKVRGGETPGNESRSQLYLQQRVGSLQVPSALFRKTMNRYIGSFVSDHLRDQRIWMFMMRYGLDKASVQKMLVSDDPAQRRAASQYAPMSLNAFSRFIAGDKVLLTYEKAKMKAVRSWMFELGQVDMDMDIDTFAQSVSKLRERGIEYKVMEDIAGIPEERQKGSGMLKDANYLGVVRDAIIKRMKLAREVSPDFDKQLKWLVMDLTGNKNEARQVYENLSGEATQFMTEYMMQKAFTDVLEGMDIIPVDSGEVWLPKDIVAQFEKWASFDYVSTPEKITRLLNRWFANIVLFWNGLPFNLNNNMGDWTAITQLHGPGFWKDNHDKHYFKQAALELYKFVQTGIPSADMFPALQGGTLDDGQMAELSGDGVGALVGRFCKAIADADGTDSWFTSDVKTKAVMSEILKDLGYNPSKGARQYLRTIRQMTSRAIGLNKITVHGKYADGAEAVKSFRGISPLNWGVNAKGVSIAREALQRLAVTYWVRDQLKAGRREASVFGGADRGRVMEYIKDLATYKNSDGDYVISPEGFNALSHQDQMEIASYISTETLGDYQDVGTLDRVVRLPVPFSQYTKIDVRRQFHGFKNDLLETGKPRLKGAISYVTKFMIAGLATKSVQSLIQALWKAGRSPEDEDEYIAQRDRGFGESLIDFGRLMTWLPIVKLGHMETGFNFRTAQSEFLERFGIGGFLEASKNKLFRTVPDQYQHLNTISYLARESAKDAKEWIGFQFSPYIALALTGFEALTGSEREEYQAKRQLRARSTGAGGKFYSDVFKTVFEGLENAMAYDDVGLDNVVRTGRKAKTAAFSWLAIRSLDRDKQLMYEYRYVTLPEAVSRISDRSLVKGWPIKRKMFDALYNNDRQMALSAARKLYQIDARPGESEGETLKRWLKYQSPYMLWYNQRGKQDVQDQRNGEVVYAEWRNGLNHDDQMRLAASYRYFYKLVDNAAEIFEFNPNHFYTARNGYITH